MRILVIDDDPVILEFMREFVELMDHPVDVFTDAGEALDSCRRNPYELVITDFKMPKMSGGHFAAELYQMNAGIPVIVVSSDAESLERDNFPHCNVVALLKKPLDLQELQKLITLIQEDSSRAAD